MSELKRVRFDCNGNNAPAYGCNLPGDNSGEYVPFVVAQALYVALECTTGELEKVKDSIGYRALTLDVIRDAKAVMKKARGE
ncbi:hypothetical protein MHM84_03460 [Halomonas sp. McH1-25]|uniref:hypothetical protein n=1 Tax=unclassified Halomonas TaxID=2609666 RepID=UPI001EF443AC|nr:MULTISPECIES: hypothetical protein [unclassified Halomonas]MCG7598829.1 hypothetical protein [Halomonas sp. McH1-25]MCP1340792.1 hypothetical protein [Halomonas sp. FL8]MCP1362215.1 hypothetical protein [Halomonas sp. BBD45]MCP1364121.1 hypothetical protein [Halomonas sp. BBD48]